MAQITKKLFCLGQKSFALQRTNIGIKITQSFQYYEKINTVSFAPCACIVSFRHYSTLGSNRQYESLWASVKGVSSQGKKKGRAKKRFFQPRRTDEKSGRGTVEFGGLHKSVFQTGEKFKPTVETRRSSKREKVYPLMRGYTGSQVRGKKFNPPETVGDYDFGKHGFESVILERRVVSNMTSNIGRSRSFRVLAVVGNKNGLAGYGVGRGKDVKTTMNQAVNRAGKYLEFIERYEDRTVLHNMFAKEIATKLYITKKQHGYGLCCHRVIKSICELAGIKDIYAKIEGPTTTFHVTRALFKAFRSQQPYQKLANKHHVHVVERKRECGSRPVVLASPQDGKIREVLTEEGRRALNFETMFWNGRIMLNRMRKPKFYEKEPSFFKKKSLEHKYRNQNDSRMKRILAGLEQLKL